MSNNSSAATTPIKRKTVGELSLDLSKKAPDAQNAIDQMREQLSEYEENVLKCIKNNRNKYEKEFYVVVLTKKERLMQNVLRGFYFARKTCPTPDYDQAVYRYTKSGDHLEFLWVIPSADTVNLMKNNVAYVPSDQYALLGFVLKFVDGTLLDFAKKQNKEKRDSNIIDTLL